MSLASQIKNLPNWILIFSLFVPAFALSSSGGSVLAAACTPPSTDYGTATTTIDIQATGTYQILSRMKADSSDANNNSYFLEIDGNTCLVIGDNNEISGSNWTWVNYTDGNTSSQATHNFSSTGTHDIKMIGREPNVSLDRVIFTQDLNCTPTGTGDNCADPPDTTPPSVSITSPANNDTVDGQVSINADASDAESGVEKVEFRVDGNVVNTDTTSPYSFTWDTTTVSDGDYNLSAVAYNNEGLDATSSTVNVTVDNPSPADLVVTNITASPANPTAGEEVTFTATIQNQGETATPGSTVHRVGFKVDGAIVAWSDDSNQSLGPGESRELTANDGVSGATWTAVNGDHNITAIADDLDNIAESNENNNVSSINLSVADSQPDDTTAPTVSVTNPSDGADVSGTVTLSADASDDVGVSKVEFYVDGTIVGGPVSTAPYSATFDTSTLSNGTHEVTAKAYDQANNEATSDPVSINVDNAQARNEDINQDGTVNLLDFSLLASKFGQSGSGLGREDINRDGAVNLLDFSLLASQFGT